MLKKIGRIFRVFLFLFIGGCLVLFGWGEIDRTIAEKNGVFSQNSSQYPMRQSDITMYTDGKQLNNQLFSDIEKAKHYVHINFFSIADDKVSHQFLELLRKKSGRCRSILCSGQVRWNFTKEKGKRIIS